MSSVYTDMLKFHNGRDLNALLLDSKFLPLSYNQMAIHVVTGDLKCPVPGWQLTFCSSGVFLYGLPCQLFFLVKELWSKDWNFEDQHLCDFLTDQTLKHWVKKYGWREEDNGMIFIANQDENIKTKNITEKIDFESAAAIMAASR